MTAVTTPADDRHRLDIALLDLWERHPDRTAIIDGDTVVTTGELRNRVLATAEALRRRGTRPGDLVVVHLPRSVDFVVSILGVVVAGAAHVALDVDDPAARTTAMIADCAPRAVLTSTAYTASLTVPAGIPVLTGHDRTGSPAPGAFPVPGPLADQPAVVIHTSGSTGRPKASLISHRALVARFAALQGTNEMTDADRIIHHTACSFDMFLIETYWPLLAGAAIVLAEPGRQRDADHLAELITTHRVTTFYCVVSLLDLFLLTRDPAERYDGIRQILTGGEPLSPDLVRRLYARTSASLTNLYGPSECTIYCTAWECPRDPLPETVLIGGPITGTQLWILDEAGEPVPPGCPGELYIGGDGLALGYLNRPEQTAQRFLSGHPVAPDGRLYRSGDLVRQRPTGELEFLGRVDRQVKIRGIRVELGEIESTALRCPGVRQAAAVAHGSGRDTALAVFIVPRGDGSPDELPSAVREVLRANLPGHMVPTVIETRPDLPLTPNGKLDTEALRQQAERGGEPARQGFVDALGADATVDDVVSAVWRDVLDIGLLRPDADFFDSGGDSFKMLQAVQRSREVLAVPIPLVTLLRAPTLAQFSAAVRHMIEEEVNA